MHCILNASHPRIQQCLKRSLSVRVSFGTVGQMGQAAVSAFQKAADWRVEPYSEALKCCPFCPLTQGYKLVPGSHSDNMAERGPMCSMWLAGPPQYGPTVARGAAEWC